MSKLKRSDIFWNVFLLMISTILVLVLGNSSIQNLIIFLAVNSYFAVNIFSIKFLRGEFHVKIYPFTLVSFAGFLIVGIPIVCKLITKFNKYLDGE